MKKLISLVVLVFLLVGCSKSNNVITPSVTKKQIFKSDILAKISTEPTPIRYDLPYVQRSKYIKILILPFKNSEGDVDYGGIIETKLEKSKFIFDDTLKKKIIKQNNFIGTL